MVMQEMWNSYEQIWMTKTHFAFDDKRKEHISITDTARKRSTCEQTFTIPNVIFPLIRVKGKDDIDSDGNEVMGACTLSETER